MVSLSINTRVDAERGAENMVTHNSKEASFNQSDNTVAVHVVGGTAQVTTSMVYENISRTFTLFYAIQFL